MIRALYVCVKSPATPSGIPGFVDSLCKMHGPRGHGDAVLFNAARSSWGSRNSAISLAASGFPDSTDRGRVWNEGLGFWGWWFYLSKFYEVVDTAIILMKGKRSATLQTYHHAGAMLCMWAGIRYMSPPIWMFALVNAGIHTLMYTYFTVTEFGYRVPPRLKQSLTTLQILQFLVGATFAASHLFVGYSIPVSESYAVVNAIARAAASSSSVVSRASQAAAAATDSSAVSSVAASATGAAVAWINKLAAWAGGAPGVAHNVFNDDNDQTFVFAGDSKEPDEIKYRTVYKTVHCLDTSGQAFAIYLNVLYLAPLTALFVRFFIKSYIFGDSRPSRSDKSRRLSASTASAWDETSRSVEAVGRHLEKSIGTMGIEVHEGGEKLTAEADLRRALQKLNEDSSDVNGQSSGAIEDDDDEGEGEGDGEDEVTEDEAAQMDGSAVDARKEESEEEVEDDNKENEPPVDDEVKDKEAEAVGEQDEHTTEEHDIDNVGDFGDEPNSNDEEPADYHKKEATEEPAIEHMDEQGEVNEGKEDRSSSSADESELHQPL